MRCSLPPIGFPVTSASGEVAWRSEEDSRVIMTALGVAEGGREAAALVMDAPHETVSLLEPMY